MAMWPINSINIVVCSGRIWVLAISLVLVLIFLLLFPPSLIIWAFAYFGG